ncbi:CRISPR-associated endonuclease Cas2 [Sedimentisphaera salicampi]|uniref:CRISPR-associated endoribonuclease Cas2 n=1 Tax=Sedimentisphaera salicampi TaxID=1941349 RepID=A0A1W6LLP1_9BACT|nr:CRISPR-associated endonuclease Cas2 [Sedimentisphaera salicampi]ARN56663.1 CRISPR-associated endoribonuclease Cas2 [Sedimentisphaera salicampi]
MLVLITYDVNTQTKDGSRRLRKVAKACENVGQRVQNSVFECLLEPAQWVELKDKLLNLADMEKDSLRFYYLGKNWQRRIEHFGSKPSYDPEGPLIV